MNRFCKGLFACLFLVSCLLSSLQGFSGELIIEVPRGDGSLSYGVIDWNLHSSAGVGVKFLDQKTGSILHKALPRKDEWEDDLGLNLIISRDNTVAAFARLLAKERIGNRSQSLVEAFGQYLKKAEESESGTLIEVKRTDGTFSYGVHTVNDINATQVKFLDEKTGTIMSKWIPRLENRHHRLGFYVIRGLEPEIFAYTEMLNSHDVGYICEDHEKALLKKLRRLLKDFDIL